MSDATGAAIAGVASERGTAWATPADHPPLPDDEVHVWKASVAALAPGEVRLRALLDAAELARAERYRFARDRTQYVVAHGLVRLLLARYLGAEPAALKFAAGPFGKPSLCEPAGGGLEFNLSHSADLVLLAVTRHRAVGVDVECWDRDIEAELLARQFFSPAERAQLAALPPDARVPGFFACWSRKEAYIKATGLGVSQGLDYFDVSLAPGEPARLLADRHATGRAAAWTLHDLAPAPGYSGAVIADGAPWRLRRFAPAGAAGAGGETGAAGDVLDARTAG
ncbi:MAG TPA: 4'-phosphopantetheinyl transferase superfamily protein [Longimicrobiales bacterium]|nr:4'-phosphopantetheinyl transferase superfamily protein [Longimicrobiales bacterium]